MGNAEYQPRFVILLHETPPGYSHPTHWDLMFEQGTALRTWALAAEPSGGVTIDAERLPDHRREYLDYEGPISGDRGQVTRWDTGTFQLVRDTAQEFVALLTGERLSGRVRLTKQATGDQRWGFSLEAG
jgi:hypothetical protein